MDKIGKVWLVGAGPSDPGLFTLKGLRALEQAQVVVYDRLVGQAVLQMMPQTAEKINVGKQSGAHPVPQEEINQILLDKAKEGKRVVRLKGGDPFVFGRGGEELELLAKNGIPFEVVPGVTAAAAVPAYAGIPVTHRDYCSSVHLITAHKKRGSEEELDYETLSRLDGTLVFYMGLSALGDICEGLLKAGMDPDMPAAVLERGTTAAQRKVVSTLSGLKEEADKANMSSPSLIVVGKVCSLADTFHWAEDRPLGKQRVVVTRPKKRSRKLADRLEALGAEVILLPAIKTRPIEDNKPLEDALQSLERYQWIGFTSAEGADCFFDALYRRKIDVRGLAGIRFAAIGPATRRSVEKRGILVELQPETYTGDAFGKLLAQSVAPGERLLLPRARIGTEQIIAPLTEAGIVFEDIPVYDTVWEQIGGTEFKLLPDDIVTFTSASTVKGFVQMMQGADLSGIRGLCIGAQTAEEAAKHGIRVEISDRADVESMVEKLLDVKDSGWK